MEVGALQSDGTLESRSLVAGIKTQSLAVEKF